MMNDVFYDAYEDMTIVMQEKVMAFLDRMETDEACDSLWQYLSNPNRLTKEVARDQLMHSVTVPHFYQESIGDRPPVDREQGLRFIECLKRILGYAVTLLKPKQMGPEMWETIMVNSYIYKKYISPFEQSDLVLIQLGYRKINSCFVYQPVLKGMDQHNNVKRVCSDLLTLRAYLEVKLNVEKVKTTDVSMPALPEMGQLGAKPVKPVDATSLCDLCNNPGQYLCDHDDDCKGKAWCETCNERWHIKNLRRKHHNYQTIPNTHTSAVKPPPISDKRVSLIAAKSKPYAVASSTVQSPPSKLSTTARPMPTPERTMARGVTPVTTERPQRQQNWQQQQRVPLVESRVDEVAQKLREKVDKLVSSEDVNILQRYIDMFNKSMADVKLKIAGTPASSPSKHEYSIELIKLNNHKRKLEERFDVLEREAKRRSRAAAIAIKDERHLSIRSQDVTQSNQMVSATTTTYDGPGPLTYLRPIAKAEEAGYSMDEILLGLKTTPFLDLMNWLETTYVTIQHAVQQAAQSLPGDVSKLTMAEIKETVVSRGLEYPDDIVYLNVQAFLTTCIETRRKLVLQYCEMFNHYQEEKPDAYFKHARVVTPEMVNATIFEANGDEEKIMSILNDKVAEVIRDYIWSPVEQEDIAFEMEGRPPVMKKVLEILQDPNVNRMTKLMVSQAELALSPAQADDVLWIINHLYGKDDRTFEIQDALKAVTNLNHDATRYLSVQCFICLDKVSRHKVASLFCHDASKEPDMECCTDCAREYFINCIICEPVTCFYCPARCGAPGKISPDKAEAHEYFEALNILFGNIQLPQQYVEKYNTKLVYWKMSADPNFYFCPSPACSQDGYGFIDEGDQLRVACPVCHTAILCRLCKECWVDGHGTRGCKDIAKWVKENTEENTKAENLGHVQICEVLWIMENIHGKDDRHFEIQDALIAVTSVPSTNLRHDAAGYLSVLCCICLDKHPKHKIASLFCHDTKDANMDCCIGCTTQHFVACIDHKAVAGVQCPACSAPGMNISADQAEAHEYFEGLLTIVFRNIQLPQQYVDKFSTKLMYWKMSGNPNFYYCPNPGCSEDGYGFIDEGQHLRIACPVCHTQIVCRQCKKEWTEEHETRTCEEFAKWTRENTEGYKEGEQQRDAHMKEHGICCPHCQSQFHLAQGGCMHFKCPQCNFEFCSGCYQQTYNRGACKRENCKGQGLHAHHPRNCNTYLRDYPVKDLQKLLADNKAQFDAGVKNVRCQKHQELDDVNVTLCGEEEQENGLCRKHYVEYLTATINANKLEVLSIIKEKVPLMMILKRAEVACPEQADGTGEEEYCNLLVRVIQAKVPLVDLSGCKIY